MFRTLKRVRQRSCCSCRSCCGHRCFNDSNVIRAFLLLLINYLFLFSLVCMQRPFYSGMDQRLLRQREHRGFVATLTSNQIQYSLVVACFSNLLQSFNMHLKLFCCYQQPPMGVFSIPLSLLSFLCCLPLVRSLHC